MSTNNQIINNGYTTQNDLLMKNLREYYSNIENNHPMYSLQSDSENRLQSA